MKTYLLIFLLCFTFLSNGFSQNSNQSQSIQNDFQNYTSSESTKNYTGSFLPVFSNKENTVGNRYLFDRWVGGKVFNADDIVVSNGSFVFNYDKIAKKLLATQDRQKIIEVNINAIKFFTLTNEEEVMVFEKIPVISEQDFFIPLVKNENKYSLYKSIKTKFERANYTTNGIFESGKNYDSFIDVFEYYIGFPGGKEFKKIELKKKSVREILAKDDKKVKQYFSKEEEGVINEHFLNGLITFLNQ